MKRLEAVSRSVPRVFRRAFAELKPRSTPVVKPALTTFVILIVVLGAAVWTADSPGEECTSLVATAGGTVDGAPLLWKNRDTGTLSNKVLFVEDQPYSFLGLVNAEHVNGRLVWAGLNSAGFAVANTATTNLPAAPAPAGAATGSAAAAEGISTNPASIMAEALRTCATVDEFERFLTRNLGRETMTRSNFLALDARGNASIFETHALGFKRLNASDVPEQYIGNTNFSRSGTEYRGGGYIRFDRLATLLKAAPGGKLSTEYILQTLARDLEHPLLSHPGRAEWSKLPANRPVWLHTNHTINRPSTASVVVIHGVRAGEDPGRTTMWVILGEPVTSVAVPLWVAAGQPPAELWEGKDAAISVEAARIKDVLRPLASAERDEYLDVTRLDNAAGTGWLPALLALERETLQKTGQLLKGKPSAAELAAFEKAAAARALSVLKGIGVKQSGH